jgi:FAD dependent oxidoreductase TIGR03364
MHPVRARHPGPVDVVVVGAGIVGLAHAAEAVRRGLSVAVVERDDFARGASIRNFGHCVVSGQAGATLSYARAARERWLELGRLAGFWTSTAGTVVAARADDELAVLAEFAAHGGAPAELLDAEEVRARVPLRTPDLVGGAWLPWDIRVDPREAVGALARWLATQGVRFHWATSTTGVSPGLVHTSRGDVAGSNVILATGHDLDRMFPDLAEEIGLRRCALHMLRVAAPDRARFEPAVLTGLSMLRYAGFADCPSLPAVRARITTERPDLLAVDMNLMFTQLLDGDLLIGDTHALARTHLPFADAGVDELVLAEIAGLLGVPALTVRERWRGYYASAPGREFLVTTPLPGVRIVVVTTGIGMTTSHGLAAAVLDDLPA